MTATIGVDSTLQIFQEPVDYAARLCPPSRIDGFASMTPALEHSVIPFKFLAKIYLFPRRVTRHGPARVVTRSIRSEPLGARLSALRRVTFLATGHAVPDVAPVHRGLPISHDGVKVVESDRFSRFAVLAYAVQIEVPGLQSGFAFGTVTPLI